LSILADPNRTAISGETASFLAGGEFPVPVPQSGVSQGAITIQFKQFGVGLSFTPTVLSENKINLKVSPEVSQLSTQGAVTINGITVPALTTRRATTTVELASGQSFAIAGLLQSNISQEARKFPWLADIPILGTLFRSDTFKREETELVIIVTPYIVRPVNSERLMAPTDINHMPMDTGRYLKGKRDLAGDGGLKTDRQ
ncbi:MAG: type II and III secretion system protein family protein, partial [Proteobacteria bacterium]|nr:type II and III secretion system protein family protein [Pseudomonadota bacterium]